MNKKLFIFYLIIVSSVHAKCPQGQVMDDVLMGACRPECKKNERYSYISNACVTAKQRCEEENGTWIWLTQSCQHFKQKTVREPAAQERAELVKKFGKDSDFIRRLVEVPAPADGDASKTTLIVVVHGTFAAESKDFVALDGTSFFSELYNFALQMAGKHKTNVHLMSVKWSGKNSDVDRQLAAEKLARIINTYYGNRATTPHIMTIAHSHGCNVVNIATNRLRDGLKIDNLIYFAPPVRQATQQDYIPVGMDKLICFYGREDLVQTVGSVNLDSAATFMDSFANMFRKRESSPRKYHTIKDQAARVYNILVRIDGFDVAHTDIRDIVPYLSETLTALDSYRLNTDLLLNIIMDPVEESFSLCVQRRMAAGLRFNPFDEHYKSMVAECRQEEGVLAKKLQEREDALVHKSYLIVPEYVLLAILKPTSEQMVAPEDRQAYDQELAYSAEKEKTYNALYKKPMRQKQSLIGRVGKYAKRVVTGDF